MLLRLKTVKAKLIATTMIIFGVVLVSLTAVTNFSYRQSVMNGIDDNLTKSSADFANFQSRRRPGFRGGRGPNDRGGPDGGPFGPPNNGGFIGPEVPPELQNRGPGGPGHMGERRPRALDPTWSAPNMVPASLTDPAEIKKSAYDPQGFLEAKKGRIVYHTVFANGEPRRVISRPIVQDGTIQGVVQIAYALGTTFAGFDKLEALLVRIVIPLGLLMAGLASFLVVKRLLAPLRVINLEAGRIGEEGFGERLNSVGNDEFAALTGTLNGMLSRLEQLYKTEKESSERLAKIVDQQRRFTSDASHELKTPLTVIKAYLGILRGSKAKVSEESASLAAMEDAANRMNALLQDLLVLARTDSGAAIARLDCSLSHIVQKAIASIIDAAERTTFEATGDYNIHCAPEEVSRVFVNLIDNALKHSGSAEHVLVKITDAETHVMVSVTDHGAGIAPEHLPHIFERFYRADESRTSDTGGSGLGLAIVEQLVQANNGKISVVSELGKGTTFTVCFEKT